MGKLGMGFCLSYLFRGVVPDEIGICHKDDQLAHENKIEEC
jgi:hypothetical protein